MNNIVQFFYYLAIVFLAFSVSNVIVFNQFWMDGRAYPPFLLFSGISVFFTFFLSSQKSINATTQIPQLLQKVFEFLIVFSFLILSYWFLVNSVHYKKEHISLFITLTVLFLFIYNYNYIRYLRKNRIGIPIVKTLVLGSNRFTKQFIKTLKSNDWIGFQPKGFYNKDQFSISDFKNFLNDKKIEAVFVNCDEFSISKEIEVALRNITEENNIKFYAISEIFGSHLLPSSYNLAGSFPYIQLFTYPLDKSYNAAVKRIFDVAFAIVFFIFIASWLFPIITMLLIVSQGFPIFFSQKRHGLDNCEFDCYKFRTMVHNKECNHKITVKNDPRVTKIGGILRKTSLDELPQFFNVLIGDMSVVGPRPHMLNQNNYYNELITKYNLRHYVKPGITGLAQVNGFRGEIKEDKDMKDRVQADIYYIKNWSFKLDISIIYRTIANMIKGDENAI